VLSTNRREVAGISRERSSRNSRISIPNRRISRLAESTRMLLADSLSALLGARNVLPRTLNALVIA